MKNRWLCLYLISTVVQTIQIIEASTSRFLAVCSSCGATLTPSEFQAVIRSNTPFSKFLCIHCKSTKGKGDKERDISSGGLYVSSASQDSVFSSSVADGDHYGSDDLLRSAGKLEDWEWEDVSATSAKLKKGKRVVLKKKGTRRIGKYPLKMHSFEKKMSAVDFQDSPEQSPLFPFHLPSWWYFLPQVAGRPHNSELQVFYNHQHVFGTVSEHPARELWYSGPLAVIVTDDGYTFFDMEKKQRLFFSEKCALDEYAATRGITYEFKVMLQGVSDLSAGNGFDGMWSRVSRSFDQYRRGVDAMYVQAERDQRQRIAEITARYEAAIKKPYHEPNTALQSSVQSDESGGNTLEEQFSKIAISD